MFYLVGLGNPGEEYKKSRHNAGKQAIERLGDLKLKNLKIIDSEEFMNNSGRAVGKVIKTKKAAEKLIVVHDDIDLPLGTMKIVWNRGTGGHRGLDSIVKVLKTKEFTRIRIGIAPTTPSGKIKKPKGEEKVLDFILKDFKPKEVEILKKVFKRVPEAIEAIITDGRDKAMNLYN